MRSPFLVTVAVFSSLSVALLAQAPPPSIHSALAVDSGYLANPGATPVVVYQQRMQFAGSEWLQFHFRDHTNLPEGSFVRLTGKRDAGMQRHAGRTLVEWDHVSAMFNGDEVTLELVAAPFSSGNRVVLDGVWQGQSGTPGVQSICGVDDRVQSFDPRQGRLWLGCTGWLISQDVMLTAGHCTTTGTRILELNVPLSTAGGSVVRANPRDQYPYTELAGLNAGVGQDWRVCRVGTNSTTGLLPTQANGGQWYALGTVPASTAGQNIRITGYGVDSDTPTFSQVQQTHVGPLSTISATSLCYATDTTGGNSGSPIIHANTGRAIGIHTHSGCTSTGGCNNGTRIDRADLQAAIASARGSTASVGTYGVGCHCLTFVSSGVPALGTTVTIGAIGVPAGVVGAAMNVGFAQQNVDLGGVGMPGCRLLNTLDIWFPMPSTSPATSTGLAIPNDSSVYGVTLFAQAAVLVPGINALGAATSNGAQLVTGW